MSTEQIEKWLDDNALAGRCSKKEDEEIIKFEEKIETKIQTEILNAIDKYKKVMMKQEKRRNENAIPENKKESSNVKISPPESAIKPSERKMIFQNSRRARKVPNPNSQAFSANNESSVYAFEADTEMPINTPFRSQIRRPSSTTTSRSEEEAAAAAKPEVEFNKFRLPTVVKPPKSQMQSQSKQEVSLMLSADEVNNSASIAVQVSGQLICNNCS